MRKRTTNNNILVSEAHHAWLKAEAERRGFSIRALVEDLVHLGMKRDRILPPRGASRHERIEHVRRAFQGDNDA